MYLLHDEHELKKGEIIMPETKVYLELSEEFEEFFFDNKISIEDILERNGIKAKITSEVVPYQVEDGARTKDLVPVILAGSTAIAAISFAISQILHEIYNKPHLVEIYENQELRDANNNVLLNDFGSPQLIPVKRYELHETHQTRELEFSLGLKNGIVIKIKSGTSQNDKEASE